MPASSLPSVPRVSIEAGRALIALARKTIEGWLAGNVERVTRSPHHELSQRNGLFVTLYAKDRLRGCIGQTQPGEPLYVLVQQLALASASKDPRFSPVTRKEWPRCVIEVSILSPLERVHDSGQIQVGRHGVMVIKGPACGVYLPGVAVDAGWSSEEFIRRCAEEKAGLPHDGWRSGEVYTFTTDIFLEKG